MLAYRLKMGSLLLAMWAVGGYGLWQVHKYAQALPRPAPEFVRKLTLNPPNPQGDSDFLCQTMYCNDNDHYVGIQTHFLYENRSHIMWGVPISYSRLKFIDGSTGTGGTHDIARMHPPNMMTAVPRLHESHVTVGSCC